MIILIFLVDEFDDDDFGDFEEAGEFNSEEGGQSYSQEKEETPVIAPKRPSITTVRHNQLYTRAHSDTTI